ncbi:MAG TPA: ATP-dependent helicase [Planctomycetes bacterium]|nr:ATP-dependent helicase [Planctomycetota bacterium]
MEQSFAPGALVRARGREWVVLPESTADLLVVRPIGGLDDEIVGISTAIEQVSSSTFAPPNPDLPGDYNACRLLRDAARISTRSAAGPFRSFAKIAVEPRPYQLVPLLMAMRLDPVRLLIADDVGIGKTIEACLVAKELLERGEVNRLAVLCPPHLAEQWQGELRDKFHIDAELVLTSTVQRLERHCRPGESLFDRYPFVIISTDFIKSTRRRDDFIRACPELVIVDEAHTCTIAGQVGRARQARFELIRAIAADPDRHLILVTATPHSGNEDAFRSLLSLVDTKFASLPSDLESDARASVRMELAKHLVQRLRGNIRDYLGSETTFPDREDAEASYTLTPEYKSLLERILTFAGEMVADESGTGRNRRVRWWSALALLRALASSPAAAAATLRNRAATADADTEEEIEELGRRAILDQDELEISEVFDLTPGGNPSEDEQSAVSRRLRRFAGEAEKLAGAKDAKLKKAMTLIKGLVKDGYNPILFCRFIDTAEYVASALRQAMTNVEIEAVTGRLSPTEREDRINALGRHERRILVCTDCLSEGINLQDHFDAVFHYDLSWNPTRHEQREGRVDRFGQPRPKVRVMTYFGVDNQIDGVVLDVLLRKHKKIKSDLGISVAVPGSSEDVIKALFEGMQLRRSKGTADAQLYLPGLDPVRTELHARWEDAKQREARSRSRFAQLSIKTDEVKAELEAVREAIGTGPAVRQFVHHVLHLAGVATTERPKGVIEVAINNETPRALRHAIGCDQPFVARFELPVDDGVIHLGRTHPIVEGLASYVLESALDEVQGEGERAIARRCGVTRTRSVSQKTSLLLVRFRFHLVVRRRGQDGNPLLAEEIRTLAFTGAPAQPEWLPDSAAIGLLDAVPAGNLPTSLIRNQLKHLIDNLGGLQPFVQEFARQRADALRDAHTRVRRSVRVSGRVQVVPVLPADILGCFILLPDQS